MADEKVRVTELPATQTLRDGGVVLINQAGVDYQAPVEKLLRTDNNLSEVDPATGRNNLNIYSKAETDQQVKLSAKAYVATSVANGLANTAVGDLFVVPQGQGQTTSFIYYRNNGTTAVVVADEPGAGVVTQVADKVTVIDNRTDGLHTSSHSKYAFEIVDEEGKGVLMIDGTGKIFVPGGLSTTDLQLTALALDNLKATSINMREGYWNNEKLLLTKTSRYAYAEVDQGGRVLFGTLNSTGEKEYLGYPLKNKVGPMRNDFFFIGDSITAFSHATSLAADNNNRNEAPTHCAQSWPMWAEFLSKGKLKYAGLSATGGFLASQILATHVPVAVAAKPTFCVVLAGRNNVVYNYSYTNTVTNLAAIYDTLRKAGIIPVLCNMCAQTGNTATQETLRYQVNDFIRAYADKYQLPFVDMHEATTDPATGGWYDNPMMHIDWSHPTGAGAKVMGAKLVEAMQPWLRNHHVRMAVNVTVPATSDNLLDNPLFYTSADSTNPDTWTVNAVAKSELLVDAAIKGKAWHVSANGATMSNHSKTVTVEPGQKYGFGFMAKMNGTAVNHCYIVSGSDATGVTFLAGIRRWNTVTDGYGYFYQEFTAPAGVTSVTIVVNANDMTLAQMGLFKITEVA